jgi:hypothetical protein
MRICIYSEQTGMKIHTSIDIYYGAIIKLGRFNLRGKVNKRPNGTH